MEGDIEILESRLVSDEKKIEKLVAFIFKTLPVLSIVLSTCGILFQVFVLYPWHEELSYEFRTLESAIIKLDEKFESKNGEFSTLKRPTDKYAESIKAKFAGPKLSKTVPFFKELEDLKDE